MAKASWKAEASRPRPKKSRLGMPMAGRPRPVDQCHRRPMLPNTNVEVGQGKGTSLYRDTMVEGNKAKKPNVKETNIREVKVRESKPILTKAKDSKAE